MTIVQGLHHITAVAADPQRNADFYTRVLGLRLVKKTVNQDDPSSYHLYYGDDRGRPGTAMTFFPFPGVPAGRPGRGQPLETRFSVPADAIPAWQSQLEDAGVPVTPGDTDIPMLHFRDPDGLPLALIGDTPSALAADTRGETAIRGFSGMSLASHRPAATARVLTELLDYAESGAGVGGTRFMSDNAPLARHIDLVDGAAPRTPGYGTVHHVAFRVADRSALLERLERLRAWRLPCSGEVDRFYFRSVYFREPGGMLFEIATDEPGFDVDEPLSSLGQSLMLTAEHEPMRAAIEARLPHLETR